MKDVHQTFQKSLRYLALAGGIAALTGCDTPEIKVLYQSQPEATGCSIRLEQKVRKANSDYCRLEVACADGKASVIFDNLCDHFSGLRISGPDKKIYTFKSPIFSELYPLRESQPPEYH